MNLVAACNLAMVCSPPLLQVYTAFELAVAGFENALRTWKSYVAIFSSQYKATKARNCYIDPVAVTADVEKDIDIAKNWKCRKLN